MGLSARAVAVALCLVASPALCLVTSPALAQAPRTKGHAALFREAKVHFDHRRWADGMPLLEQTLEAARAELGEESAVVYDYAFKLAEVYTLVGDMKRAIPQMEEAVVLYRGAVGKGPGLAGVMHRLAQYHHAVGDHDARVRVLREALDEVAGHDPIIPTYLNALADAYADQGDYAAVVPLSERAAKLSDVEGKRAHMVEPLNRLGIALSWLGRYAEGEKAYRRALEVAEQTLGPDHLVVANVLNSLGTAVTLEGDPARERALYERGIRIAEAHGPAGTHILGTLLHNLAITIERQGDREAAIALERRASKVIEEAFGTEHLRYALALDKLGRRLLETRPALAEEAFAKALAIREKHRGAKHPEVAQMHERLAWVALRTGRFVEARAHNAKALAVYEEVLEPDNHLIARALERDARAALRGGEPIDEVAATYRRARAVRVKALGPRHYDMGELERQLAHVALVRGDARAAVAHLREATAIEDTALAALMGGAGTDQHRRTVAAELDDTTSLALDLALLHHASEPAALTLAAEVVLRRKALALELMTEQLAGRDDRRALQQARSRLAAALLDEEGERDVEQARLEVESLQAEAPQRAGAKAVSVEAIAAALGSDEALVEITSFQPMTARLNASGARRYGALVMRRSGVVGGLALAEVGRIDRLAEAMRRDASDPAADPARAARELFDAVVAPLLPLLGDAQTLRLSLDGELFLVPFAALVDDQGKRLLERLHVSYLNTGRELLRDPSVRERGAPLLVGAPAFGEATDPPRGGMVFEPLPGAEVEVRAIAERLAALRPRLLLGDEAEEGAVKAARAPALLHLATHGYFLSGGSASATDGQRGVKVTRQREESLGLDAQLRSALVFAGVHAPAGDDDGVLTAFEAATMDLHGTELVVMSGCETGVGDVEQASGVLGLRRAFALAGAQTQVMSLWRVSDESTRDLMVRYYEGLLAGRGRADALRDAQLALAQNEATAHPYHWAGFIVSGNPAPLSGVAPPPPVAPTGGCACDVAPGGERGDAIWALALAAMAFSSRRRARRGRRGVGRPRSRSCRSS